MEHTLVVPPVYEAQLFGQGHVAAQIGVRKVWLLDQAYARAMSCNYKASDNVAGMSFAQLVDFVIARQS